MSHLCSDLSPPPIIYWISLKIVRVCSMHISLSWSLLQAWQVLAPKDGGMDEQVVALTTKTYLSLSVQHFTCLTNTPGPSKC